MNNILKNKKGTALLMTILILNAIVVISLAAAKLIMTGVKMGGTQAKSTKAYFAGEAGAERVLWEWRKNGWDFPPASQNNIFSGSLQGGSSYQVDYASSSPTVLLRSAGAYTDMRRTVELELDF